MAYYYYSSPIVVHSSRNSSLPSRSPQRLSDPMNRNRSLLGSIKSTFAASGKSDMASGNPYSATQPTRRPPAGHNPFLAAAATNDPPPAYSPPGASAQPQSTLGSGDTVNGSEAAPAYSPSSSPAGSSAPATAAAEADDAYSFLSSFDTAFLIDDSGSMAGRSWRECSQALETITPICTAHDADGIDIYFLNTPSQPHFSNVTLSSTVHEIFSTVRPSGGTPTGQRLNAILKSYLRAYEASPDATKPLNIIVITDGVPSDDVESVLIGAARKLDRLDAAPWQVGVQFFQTGEEEGAAEHLAGLDDELTRMGGGCRDIVDTVPFQRGANGRGVGLTGEDILKVVLGAVNKRLDRRSNNSAR